ncbi:MAG: endonuclease [Sphingomonadales bacterium 32-68-7]|nr:MAG: endonuclease [Sphingomonadales bacterium 12-68-11]OYX08564.1 MAG: endonuclease [Sphingomonadales bacterium 32-68-7]
MRLTFASYNIHKAVGLDRRRDPERILSVLHELGADVVALQEADRRFGGRAAVLPRRLLDEHGWHAAMLRMTPDGMAWHGNAILVRKGIEIVAAEAIALPMLEPRGAVRATLRAGVHEFQVVGMHLDLSGLVRRRQVETICAAAHRSGAPAVLLGDLNEWSARGGALRGIPPDWSIVGCGRSFPARRPLAPLDRIVHSPHWRCEHGRVHHSAQAAVASDHLPVVAALTLGA